MVRVRVATMLVTRGRRRGAAAAEFALLLVPLTVLLLGTVDFCRVFYAYNTINNCARNGAAWASDPYANNVAALWGTTTPAARTSPYASLQLAAQADAEADPATKLSPTPTVGGSDPVYGTDAAGNKTVTVTVSYTFTLLTSYLFGTTSFQMARSVTMRAIPPFPN